MISFTQKRNGRYGFRLRGDDFDEENSFRKSKNLPSSVVKKENASVDEASIHESTIIIMILRIIEVRSQMRKY